MFSTTPYILSWKCSIQLQGWYSEVRGGSPSPKSYTQRIRGAKEVRNEGYRGQIESLHDCRSCKRRRGQKKEQDEYAEILDPQNVEEPR